VCTRGSNRGASGRPLNSPLGITGESAPTFDSLFPLVFVAIAGYFLYRFVKYGGLRGVLYGSTVARTIGEIPLPRRAGTTTTLRVHILEDGRIVLEQSSRALLAASISGLPMNSADVDRLIALLRQPRS
jgi:hypothetical protein